MDKKGQGLSLNTIIIAIIVLVVLVVLIMVFTGVLGNFTGEVSSCVSNGGECATACEGEDFFGTERKPLGDYDDSCKKADPTKSKCCSISFGNKPGGSN